MTRIDVLGAQAGAVREDPSHDPRAPRVGTPGVRPVGAVGVMALLTEERQKPSVHHRDSGDAAIFGGDLGKVRHSHTAAVALRTAEPNVAARRGEHLDRVALARVAFLRLGFRVRVEDADGSIVGRTRRDLSEAGFADRAKHAAPGTTAQAEPAGHATLTAAAREGTTPLIDEGGDVERRVAGHDAPKAYVEGDSDVGKVLSAASKERRSAEDDGRVVGPSRERGDVRIVAALAIWAVSTLGFVLMVLYLVPDFPWWITALFGFVWTPIYSYIGTRMIGLTGSPQGVTCPYLREASFYLSGYQGAGIWFAPVPIFQWGYEAQIFKQLELTRTHFASIVKMTALTLAVMFVCSFLFWSLIWKLGPIPSRPIPSCRRCGPFTRRCRLSGLSPLCRARGRAW